MVQLHQENKICTSDNQERRVCENQYASQSTVSVIQKPNNCFLHAVADYYYYKSWVAVRTVPGREGPEFSGGSFDPHEQIRHGRTYGGGRISMGSATPHPKARAAASPTFLGPRRRVTEFGMITHVGERRVLWRHPPPPHPNGRGPSVR